MSTLTLRKSPMAEAVSGPLNLRAPLPKEAMDEVRAEVEVITPRLDLSQILPDAVAGIQIDIPMYWSKGALLNVRNRGDHYCITLYPEEFDPRHPERAMMFPNTWTCQDFVSKWYSRETADPRAR